MLDFTVVYSAVTLHCLYDAHGDIVIPFDYGYIYRTDEGFTRIKGGRYIYYYGPDKELHTTIDIGRALTITGGFTEGYAVTLKAGEWGYIDANGNVVIPNIYTAACPFNNGYAAVRDETGWGLIDTNGEVAVPLIYDFIYQNPLGSAAYILEGGLLGAKKNDKWGVINTHGSVIIPFIFDGFSFPSDDNFIKVKQEGKWGILEIVH